MGGLSVGWVGESNAGLRPLGWAAFPEAGMGVSSPPPHHSLAFCSEPPLTAQASVVVACSPRALAPLHQGVAKRDVLCFLLCQGEPCGTWVGGARGVLW